MAANNGMNMPLPLEVSNGGIGLTSFSVTNSVLYTGSSGTGNLQFLSSNGTAGQIISADGSGGYNWSTQGWKLIQSQTASNSADLTFTTGWTSSYRMYQVVLSQIVPATNSVSFQAQYSSDGGATWQATSYLSGSNINAYNSTARTNLTSTTSVLLSSNNLSNVGGTTPGLSGIFYLFNMADTSRQQFIGSAISGSGSNILASSHNQTLVNSNALKFFCSSGNITSGNITIYGQT